MSGRAGAVAQPRGEERAWFEAAAEGWLALGRCHHCGAWFLPRVVCPRCWSQDVGIERASGRGTVYSFTVLHRPMHRWFAERLPYAVALVQTEEGVRVVSNLVEIAPDSVAIGMPVEVSFEDRGDEIVPVFRPAP